MRVRISNEARNELVDVANVNLLAGNGTEMVPLTALSELTIKPSRGAIPHREGMRVNVIEGYLRAGILPSVVLNRIQTNMADENFTLPSGYRIEVGGESAERNTAVSKLLASIGIILTLLITVVVLSFNSFRISTIIFSFCIPIHRFRFAQCLCVQSPVRLYRYCRFIGLDGLSDKCFDSDYCRVKSRSFGSERGPASDYQGCSKLHSPYHFNHNHHRWWVFAIDSCWRWFLAAVCYRDCWRYGTDNLTVFLLSYQRHFHFLVAKKPFELSTQDEQAIAHA